MAEPQASTGTNAFLESARSSSAMIAMGVIAIIAELDLADSKNAFVPVLACGSAI